MNTKTTLLMAASLIASLAAVTVNAQSVKNYNSKVAALSQQRPLAFPASLRGASSQPGAGSSKLALLKTGPKRDRLPEATAVSLAEYNSRRALISHQEREVELAPLK